ncbi:paralemmin-3 [Pipistrellus kuhlii]|uniref:Paralemmin 3 n=1 Tax=Pipistrellus kuhlii TaxID=59472 RepID=A0A7J7TB10_PIPKU|nr:paralemmin-3 [Pipistrellus kuhlii]KAF6297660.1 paralemmin 3 [Pipistrellus kuhlii]
MALQSQVRSPATPIPMAESSLYRQRLEVIAEKRRLQEQIRAARGELEEEKLRVERLKRKSLRERWLMDGAEGPEGPEEAALQDPETPEGQAQDRIRNLEDSLFTLQSQLQLLQSASTGAQHKASGRPTWRRQGHRPLSQPTAEAGTEGQTDLNKRASWPAEPAGTSLESLAEPRDEAFGVLPALRQVPGAAGVSSEANGPCPRPSPPLEQEHNQGVTAAYGGVGEAKGGGVVKVVWEGLRPTEDCARGATGPELEAKVEEMVLEAIGDRLEASRPELPSWVREDRGVVEVVWEGVGGTEGSDSEASGEAGRGPPQAQTSSPRLQEEREGEASGTGEGPPRGSPDGFRHGGPGGEEGSFIWVERVTLSEEWEELMVEGVEGPRTLGKERGGESPPGVGRLGGEETWETERRRAEESLGTWKKGGEEQSGAAWEGIDTSLAAEKKGREEPVKPERRRGEGKAEAGRDSGEDALPAESEGTKGAWRAETEGGEEPLGAEQRGGEEKLEAEKDAEGPVGVESKAVEGSLRPEEERAEGKLRAEEKGVEEEKGVVEKKGDEEKLEATEEPLTTERKEGEGSLTAERTGDEEPRDEEEKEEESPKAERIGGEGPLEAERTGGEGPLTAERTGDEGPLEAERTGSEGPLEAERTGGEGPLAAERTGGEGPLEAERTGGEGPLEAEKSQKVKEDVSPEAQRESGTGEECQAEKVSEAGASPGAQEELRPEEEGPQPSQEKQEGLPEEEEAGKPQTPAAEGQDPSGDATPLLAETPAPEQPAECQPLLPVEEPKANPRAHPVPTYAPAQQPEPSAPPEGEEASGPKQKTCQCCAVM